MWCSLLISSFMIFDFIPVLLIWRAITTAEKIILCTELFVTNVSLLGRCWHYKEVAKADIIVILNCYWCYNIVASSPFLSPIYENSTLFWTNVALVIVFFLNISTWCFLVGFRFIWHKAQWGYWVWRIC